MDKEELINGYFEGSLSQDQLEEVTRLLETDTAFAADFEFQKELQLSLKKNERQEIKAMFSELADKKKKPDTKVIPLRSWLAAASIVLVVGLGSWFLFFANPDIDTNELYAANFTPYDNVVHPIERGNQLEDLRSKAFMAYENGEYPEAFELFKELQSKQNDSYIDFYSAMVLMQLDRQKEAIPLLENYIAKKSELKDRAAWYLALAHLKIGDIEASKTALKKLIDSGSFKTEAAKKLLDQLD